MAVTPQGERVAAVLARQPRAGDDRAFFDALLAALGSEPRLEEDTRNRLKVALRGATGWELIERVEEHVRFWQSALLRYPHDAWIRAVYADSLLNLGPPAEAFEEMMRALEAQPLLLHEFGADLPELAASLGPQAVLRHRLACLRAAESRRPPDREYIAELLTQLEHDFPEAPEVRALGTRGSVQS